MVPKCMMMIVGIVSKLSEIIGTKSGLFFYTVTYNVLDYLRRIIGSLYPIMSRPTTHNWAGLLSGCEMFDHHHAGQLQIDRYRFPYDFLLCR